MINHRPSISLILMALFAVCLTGGVPRAFGATPDMTKAEKAVSTGEETVRQLAPGDKILEQDAVYQLVQ